MEIEKEGIEWVSAEESGRREGYWRKIPVTRENPTQDQLDHRSRFAQAAKATAGITGTVESPDGRDVPLSAVVLGDNLRSVSPKFKTAVAEEPQLNEKSNSNRLLDLFECLQQQRLEEKMMSDQQALLDERKAENERHHQIFKRNCIEDMRKLREIEDAFIETNFKKNLQTIEDNKAASMKLLSNKIQELRNEVELSKNKWTLKKEWDDLEAAIPQKK